MHDVPADSAAPPDSLPRNVRVLGLTSLLNDIAGEMIFPLLPTFVIGTLGGGAASLGLIEGIAETTASLVKLFSGAISDRSGRRKAFVLSGYILAAISRPIVALAQQPWHVVVVRFSDRFGKGIRSAPRDAMVADATSERTRGRAYGFTRAMDHLGAAIGPGIAYVYLTMYPDQLRSLFWLAVIPGALAVLLVLFGLREPKPSSPVSIAKEPAWIPLLAPLDRNFRIYLVALFVFTLGGSSDAFLLLRLSELGVREAHLPLVWGAVHIVKSSGSLMAGLAIDRFGPRPAIYAGWLLYATVYVAFSLVTTAWQGIGVFMIYGVFYALTEPAERTLVASLVGPQYKGLAFGWFNLAIGLGALPANLIFGALYEAYGSTIAFGTGAALALVAAGIFSAVSTGGAAKPNTNH